MAKGLGAKYQRTLCVVVFSVVSLTVAQAQFWPQWALNPQHTGQVVVSGQPLNNILTSVVYDPLVPAEMAANANSLLAHYQVPLIDGPKIFMEFKSGTYNKNRYSTETWGENGFQWVNGQFLQIWSFTSDWEAPGSQADFWGNQCSMASWPTDTYMFPARLELSLS